jgi:translation initiation factor IF-2
MARIAVNDLAKELGLSNRELMDVAYELGIVATESTSVLSEAEAALIRQHLKPHRRAKTDDKAEKQSQPLRIVKVHKEEDGETVLLEEREVAEEETAPAKGKPGKQPKEPEKGAAAAEKAPPGKISKGQKGEKKAVAPAEISEKAVEKGEIPPEAGRAKPEEKPKPVQTKGAVIRKASAEELKRLKESREMGKRKPVEKKGKPSPPAAVGKEGKIPTEKRREGERRKRERERPRKPKPTKPGAQRPAEKPRPEKRIPGKAPGEGFRREHPRPPRPRPEMPGAVRHPRPGADIIAKEEELRVRRPGQRLERKSFEPVAEGMEGERRVGGKPRFKQRDEEEGIVLRADRLRGGLKELEEEMEHISTRRRRRRRKKKSAMEALFKPIKPKKKEVSKTQLKKKRAEERAKIKMVDLKDGLTVAEFAVLIKEHPQVVMTKAGEMGEEVENIASILSSEAMLAMASDLGFEVSYDEKAVSSEAGLVKRPPVVAMLGHVDHGKTSLLDVIRQSKVTAGEAGGITQHIGASVVDYQGHALVFLDTPGHEAFTAMRARGAQVTDIVVLVVAADDGVMPQTIEALNHAKASEVAIVVAINKIDKPGVNAESIKQELSKLELTPEEWGGETFFVKTSALTGEGIDTLLDMIVLAADALKLRANPNRRATGVTIEAELDRSKGSVATVLITDGTLRVGDHFVLGSNYGKVRAMYDYQGQSITEANPSTPVKLLGLTGVAQAGDALVVLPETLAKQLAEQLAEEKELAQAPVERISLDDWFNQLTSGKTNELNLILKGDVFGTVEAISDSVKNLGNEEAKPKIIHSGVGNVNESDVLLAQASGAVVMAFDVGIDPRAKSIAELKGVDVRFYTIIYEILEDIRAALEGMLAPEVREVDLGKAEVRQVFSLPKGGAVAGCMVTAGKVVRGCKVNVLRLEETIFTGKVESLKRFKDNVKEVASGFECGIVIGGFNDLAVGDILEFVGEEVVSRRLT